jgi:hypothetical protein
MSTTHYIQTAIEVLVLIAIIVGFMYEPVLAKWEEKQSKKMLKAFKKMKELRK